MMRFSGLGTVRRLVAGMSIQKIDNAQEYVHGGLLLACHPAKEIQGRNPQVIMQGRRPAQDCGGFFESQRVHVVLHDSA